MPLFDIIRHGEPETRGLLLGRTDIALSEAGWRQFEQQTAARDWDAVVSSPLRRACDPAGKLARSRDLPLRIDPDWAEMDFGAWDGRPLSELRATMEIAAQLDVFYHDAAAPGAPGGETWHALCRRIARALHRQLDEPTQDPVLIVTHAGAMRAVLNEACDFPFESTWSIKIDYGTRLTARIERQRDRRLWGEIIEIVQP